MLYNRAAFPFSASVILTFPSSASFAIRDRR
jgi:hypothetical protein